MNMDFNNTGHFVEQKDDVSSDDATWILTSAFIIFTMQSGFGLLESGLVSQKNEVNIMVKNAVDVIFGGLAFWMFGFAFSFGNSKGTNPFCGMGFFFTDADGKNMGYVFSKYFFQLSFATTATTIVSGAMAERTNLKAYTAFAFFNTLGYCFPAHWIWAPNGWLKVRGVVDIAGSGAVHVVGGVSGLVATIYLKPRTDFFKAGTRNTKTYTMASPTNVVLGTFMLWWGWLGFNCGSTFGISGQKWKLAARSAVCTINASVGGGISGMIYSHICYKKKMDIKVFVTGILGGLVGITAICAVTKPSYALVIGVIGGFVSCFGCKLLTRLRIDDPVACVPVHFFSGVWSLVAVAFFLEKDDYGHFTSETGIFNGGRWQILGIQIALILSVSLWSGCITLILLCIINTIVPIRLSLEDEIKGADETEHDILYRVSDGHRECYTYGTRKVVNNWMNAEDRTTNRVHEVTNDQNGVMSQLGKNATLTTIPRSISLSESKLRSIRLALGNEGDGKQNNGYCDAYESTS